MEDATQKERPGDPRKDVLRGGRGERGRPTNPPTNDDPLNGGSGMTRPGDDQSGQRDGSDLDRLPGVEIVPPR